MKGFVFLILVFVGALGSAAENIILTQAGTLASALGDKLLTVEALSIEGQINETDFNTLWRATYDGKLKIIDLSNTTIEGDKIPDNAFFHYEQADHVTGIVTATQLEKIVLPEGVTEIGKFAFAYSFLEEINWPSTVKIIDKCAFTDCMQYSPDVMQLPESLEIIGSQAFHNCLMWETEVILPDGLRSIETAAFLSCEISKINFPESLEYIGFKAFSYTRLSDIILPSNCQLSADGEQFASNFMLKYAMLPSDITSLPPGLFNNCIELTEITLPGSITEIGDEAFLYCLALSSIRCEASMPPHCGIDTFTGVSKSIPVYIPTGTKSLYKSSPVWQDFSNFIETDMSGAGLQEITIDNNYKSVIYDLYGRPLSTPLPGQICICEGRKVLFQNK
ncbi:MAG: leucine-rich repeat protein [Duncaniella sp.]|nr:leucine-rich repeat protein [Duncaniella sp.]HBI59045.1 hypothetical protein [Porphyromonadaceae bacterium]